MENNTLRRILEKIRTFFRRYPVAACLSMLAGLLLIVFPNGALNILIRVIGGATLLYGLLRILAFAGGNSEGALTLIRLLTAAAILVVGVVLLVDPAGAVGFLLAVTGVYLLVDGGIKLYRLLMARSSLLSSYGIRPESEREKRLLTVGYVFTLVLGVLLLVWPGSVAKNVVRFAGVALFLEGLQSLFTWLALRKIAKTPQKDDRDPNTYYVNDFVDKS